MSLIRRRKLFNKVYHYIPNGFERHILYVSYINTIFIQYLVCFAFALLAPQTSVSSVPFLLPVSYGVLAIHVCVTTHI